MNRVLIWVGLGDFGIWDVHKSVCKLVGVLLSWVLGVTKLRLSLGYL